MSWKNLIFKEEEELPKENKIPNPSVQPTPSTGVNTIISPFVDTGDYGSILEDVFEKTNLPGPDFLEFYKALKTLENQPIAEEQKYVSSFTAFQIMGLTKDQVIQTSKQYEKALEDEAEEFNKELTRKKKEAVIDKRTRVEVLSKENLELQAKIQTNIAEISALNTEAINSESNLEVKSKQFTLAKNSAIAKIQEIITNTQKYIK